MKKMLAIAVLGACACTMAQAKDAKFYQKGHLISMQAVPCGYAEKSGKTVLGEIVGTDGAHKNTKEMLCQEYVLRGDKVLYRIRPRDEKHPQLLPIDEDAQFRIHKDKLYLKIVEVDDKERDYFVVSMTPIERDTESAAK